MHSENKARIKNCGLCCGILSALPITFYLDIPFYFQHSFGFSQHHKIGNVALSTHSVFFRRGEMGGGGKSPLLILGFPGGPFFPSCLDWRRHKRKDGRKKGREGPGNRRSLSPFPPPPLSSSWTLLLLLLFLPSGTGNDAPFLHACYVLHKQEAKFFMGGGGSKKGVLRR